jgi:hypothetical protein
VDDEVLEGVAPLATLRHLRVHNTIERWPRDCKGYLEASSQGNLACLRSLDLKVALDSDARMMCTTFIIASCSLLRGLCLTACNMDDGVSRDLAEALRGLLKLEVVDLSDNAITIHGANVLAAVLCRHPRIEILDLRGCMQTASEAPAWNALGNNYPFVNWDESHDHGVDLWAL